MSKQIHFEEIDLDEIFGEVEGPDDEPTNFHSMFMSNYANKSFKFWVLHTNFNLSHAVLRKMADSPGVERLIPITRYRALINFGLLFQPEDVQNHILDTINKVFTSNGLRQKLKGKLPKRGNLKQEDN